MRRFSDREVPDDVLRDILDTGRWTGSAKNTQPWDLVVAHGVGSCIGSIYPRDNEQRARELLGIPADRHLRTMLSIGYPAGPQALRLPPNAGIPRGRRPLTDIVSWKRFGTRG